MDPQDIPPPIPWRPEGKLAPQVDSPGEWHMIPVDSYLHLHHHTCGCGPELEVKGEKSLWVHKLRTGS